MFCQPQRVVPSARQIVDRDAADQRERIGSSVRAETDAI
jgi:hypothetical protein